MGIVKKIKDKVKDMSKSRNRKTGPMVPKAGVGNHSRYGCGGKLKKK